MGPALAEVASSRAGFGVADFVRVSKLPRSARHRRHDGAVSRGVVRNVRNGGCGASDAVVARVPRHGRSRRTLATVRMRSQVNSRSAPARTCSERRTNGRTSGSRVSRQPPYRRFSPDPLSINVRGRGVRQKAAMCRTFVATPPTPRQAARRAQTGDPRRTHLSSMHLRTFSPPTAGAAPAVSRAATSGVMRGSVERRRLGPGSGSAAGSGSADGCTPTAGVGATTSSGGSVPTARRRGGGAGRRPSPEDRRDRQRDERADEAVDLAAEQQREDHEQGVQPQRAAEDVRRDHVALELLQREEQQRHPDRRQRVLHERDDDRRQRPDHRPDVRHELQTPKNSPNANAYVRPSGKIPSTPKIHSATPALVPMMRLKSSWPRT